MEPLVLCRPLEAEAISDELAAIRAARFRFSENVEAIPEGSLVFPRFYPFYQYLTLESVDSRLVTSAEQLEFISDLRRWYPLLEGLTARSWESEEQLAESSYEGPFFAKGIDKSLKYDFSELCYAENRTELSTLLEILRETVLGYKPLVIREFLRLKHYGLIETMGNAPLAHEFRTFVYEGEIVSQGFYWEKLRPAHSIEEFGPEPPRELIDEVVWRVGERASYYSIDTALQENGEWTVIELNDGCLSGLGGIDPELHYRRLAAAVALAESAL